MPARCLARWATRREGDKKLNGESIVNQQKSSWTRTAAPGEVIYSEGFAGEPVLYVITEGKV